MHSTLDTSDFQTRLQRLDGLLREAERLTDHAARAHLQAVVQALLELHGAGLERLLERVMATENGQAVIDACAHDEVVSGLLLLHGLHPLDLEARVQQALDQVQPNLREHGGSVVLLDVIDGAVRLRVDCNDSTRATMRKTIEEAIWANAPDITSVEIEGLTETMEDGRLALPLV
jgi:Fe-S cluster biogenesis protein NfuA